MAEAADPRSIAAHLAAALIAAGRPLENAKGGPAAAAARIYFDVLDAVKKEQDKFQCLGKPVAVLRAGGLLLCANLASLELIPGRSSSTWDAITVPGGERSAFNE
jgi:hypothetical protein